MKKEHLYTIIGGTILAVVLLSGNCFGNNKHVIVKLKGNILYAGHENKNQDKTSGNLQVAVVHKKVQPVLKVNKNEVAAVAQQPAVKKEIQKPTLKVEKNQVVAITPKPEIALPPPVTTKVDFRDKQENIHAQIFQFYPGTYIDSVSLVNQLLNDTLRSEIAKVNSNERKEYLNRCLTNSLLDSITLSKLNTLSSDEPSSRFCSEGVLIAHCKDASNSSNMDSVVMDVFAGSTLMASATSDKSGTIQCKGIPEGNYYVVFSRNTYAPFSLMRVKVSNVGQSYIDIPLTRQDGYLFRTFGKNAWLFVTFGILLLLISIVVPAYYLAKYNARKTLHTI